MARLARLDSATSGETVTETEVARVPLEVGHAKHSAGGLDVPAGALEARLLDRYGNVMARLPVASAAPALAASDTGGDGEARPTGPASGPRPASSMPATSINGQSGRAAPTY